jgi:hypothetical protein
MNRAPSGSGRPSTSPSNDPHRVCGDIPAQPGASTRFMFEGDLWIGWLALASLLPVQWVIRETVF